MQLERALSRKLRINKSSPILKVLKTIASNLTETVTADHRSPIKTLSNMLLIVTSMPILKALELILILTFESGQH